MRVAGVAKWKATRAPISSLTARRRLADHERVTSSSPEIGPALAGEPAVRAKFLQQWLTFPEQFEPASAARLARLVNDEKRHAIQAAHALVWLPMTLDIEVVDAVAHAVGAQRYAELTRAFFLELMLRPPLGALLELGTKLMGLSPEAFLRWWDKGWGAVYRNCGRVGGYVDDERRGRVLYRNMPRLCLQSDAFVEAVVGTAYGVYALTGVEGVVRVTQRRVDQGELDLELEWQAQRASQPRGTA
jgi:hypothetical protein